MIVVLDASAGIEISLDREKAAVFFDVLSRATKIITTDLYKAETANAMRKYVKARLMSKQNALRVWNFCDNLIDEYVDISENAEESLAESVNVDHSTYDLLYMTLARRYGACLLTMDKKLKSLSEKNGIDTV